MRVVVKPLPIKKWHGKTGKDDFTRAKKIRALVDGEKSVYKTGLTETDIEYLKKSGVMLELHNRFDPTKPHPFWDSKAATVTLENNTMFFDTDNPFDFIKVKIMKASPFVANSFEAWERGEYPDATHYIVDEEEEIEKKAQKVSVKRECYVVFKDLTTARKKQILLLVTGKLMDNASENKIDVELSAAIEKDPRKVLFYMKMDKKKLKILSVIHEALQKGVLVRKNMAIHFGDYNLGHSIEDIALKLSKKENQEMYLQIMSRIQS